MSASSVAPVAQAMSQARPMAGAQGQQHAKEMCSYFQMPLHYPRYTRADYETMPEWKVDGLLRQYGLPATGDLNCKRGFAMGAFLWPTQ